MNHGGRIALPAFLPTRFHRSGARSSFKGLQLKAFWREMFETWYKMASMLQSGLDISPIITHRFPVESFSGSFDVMTHGQSGKVDPGLGGIIPAVFEEWENMASRSFFSAPGLYLSYCLSHPANQFARWSARRPHPGAALSEVDPVLVRAEPFLVLLLGSLCSVSAWAGVLLACLASRDSPDKFGMLCSVTVLVAPWVILSFLVIQGGLFMDSVETLLLRPAFSPSFWVPAGPSLVVIWLLRWFSSG